ncbi:MAG: hypothetical protein WAQ28_15955 [Bacteroidia bacterium]|jgi:hypothetical protein
MRYKIIFIFLLSSFISLPFFAQETKDDLTRLESGEDVNVLYRHEQNFGVFIHSAGGFGAAYRRGVHVTGKRKRMFEVEASNFKHPKEVKSVNSYYGNSKGFVYGKLNSVLLLRGGVGYQNILFQKSDKKSVEVRYSYFLGATLGVAKPVYLEIHKGNTTVPSTERYDPAIHKQEDIYGKASFFKGIEKTSIYPAGYAKLGLSFEYADRFNAIKAIETGAVADVYPFALPLMANNKKQQVYVSLYLKMIWGKKWF